MLLSLATLFLFTSIIEATAIDMQESTRPTPMRCKCVTPVGMPVILRITGTKMKSGEPILINEKLQPITDRWVSDLVPKLAERAGNQRAPEGFLSEHEQALPGGSGWRTVGVGGNYEFLI